MKLPDDRPAAYVPVGCGDVEYAELACMDRYTVRVETDGESVIGIATDIRHDGAGEYLVIRPDDGHDQCVRLDRIRRIVVLSEERRFDEWEFSHPAQALQGA